MSIEDGVYVGLVKTASVPGPVAQGVVRYTLTTNTPNGPLDLGPIVSFQKAWAPQDLVLAWPIGTPLTFAVMGDRIVGLFWERPDVGDCTP